MRAAAGIAVACLVAGSLAGCSAQVSRQGASAPPTAGEAAPSQPSGAQPSDDEPSGAGSTDPGTPAPTDEPTAPAPTSSSSTSSLPPARTDVPDAALLPAQQGVGDASGVVAWTFPPGCDESAPSAAAAMRTLTDGDGRFGTVVRVQQVAAFPDTAAAVAEARRLDREMQRCADDGAGDPDGLRLAGPVAVGAQGYGLARRYDAGGTPAPFGTYAAITRRGNAVTLVAHARGETSVEGSRRVVLADAQAAWERLCLYDRTAGCPPG